MKHFLIVILMLSFSHSAFSQWGVVAGVNMSTISGLSSTEYMTSGHIGGTYDYKLSEKWYFQPELLFTSTGYNLKENLVIKGGQFR